MAAKGGKGAPRTRDAAAKTITIGVAALVGALTCLIVAFAAAPVASALGGFAAVLALAAGTVALAAARRAGAARAACEKLSGEIDLISERLLRLEGRPLAAPGPGTPAGPDVIAEVTAEIGILGGLVRELAVAVGAQDGDIAALKDRAAAADAAPPVAARGPAPSPTIVARRPAPAAPLPAAAGMAPAAAAPSSTRIEPAILASQAVASAAPALPDLAADAALPPIPHALLRATRSRPWTPGAEPLPPSRAALEEDAAARRGAEIAAAFAKGDLEVHLQPIVALPQRRVALYEALPRLRLGEERLAPSAFGPALARVGGAPDLDRLMLARAVTVARHLAERGSGSQLVYALSGPDAAEAGFLRALARLVEVHPEVHGRLVLALPQRAWRGLTAEAAGALAGLAGRVGLMLDRVQDLRLDALALAERGIGHVKIPAAMLTGGAGPAGADIASADLAAVLARAGIRLIAEGVDREADVPELLDADVPLAQGTALAPPRVVRAEVLAPGTATPRSEAAPSGPGPAPSVAPIVLEESGEQPPEPPTRLPFRSFLRRAS